jgi:hypothetical protein
MRHRGPVLVLLLGLLGCGQSDQDTDVTCPAGNAKCLIEAITTANANGQTNTIRLEAGTYLLTAVDHDTDGPTGLPAITSPWPLTIQGAGAATTIIARDTSAPAFRLLRVAAPGTLTLQGLTLRDGGGFSPLSPPPQGGGISNTGTLILTQSTLADNQGYDGGGIYNTGTLTLTNCALTGNWAYAGGAGIYNTGTLTLTNCALTSNWAYAGDGAGIYNTGTGTLTNATLAANGCGHCSGGGIYNTGALTLTNATLATNYGAAGGGGIANLSGSTTLQNTILARNGSFLLGLGDCSGVVTSLGTNLIGLSGYPFARCDLTLQSSDLTGDPGLDVFTDDGTPGQGHFPLLSTSRAIDAGMEGTCPPTDQLGHPRAGRCDIGAIEFQPRDTPPPAAPP